MKISARYEVLGLLGQGGMGVVYHVRDTTRGRENALKTLAPGRSDDIVERFLTEAQVMFRLEHANIVRVYDFGKDGETYFLTMELIRGKNLRQLLNARQNKGFPLNEVIRMGIETSDALNYAHSQKPEAVVHRDIKPVNIMVEEETGRVVVTDFGIAKLMADTGGETQAASDLSRTVFAGTVPYSAPEQFQPAGPGRRLDARVDIYALGIVLYEIYTGRHFFAGLSADEVELHHRSIDSGECPVKSPHACDHKVVLPETPASFVRVIERAIARDRNERYKTAAEVLADLQACAAAESVHAVVSAREAAESVGAADASPTDFRRGGELEQQAKDAQDHGDHAKAGELYRGALQAFGAAAAQAGDRRARQAVQEARAAMQKIAQEATEKDTAALAPDAMRRAAQLVAAAEAGEAQGNLEDAAGSFQRAAEAFREALAQAERAKARKALEAELPALHAAREAAEQADAPRLAADVFAGAVRDQQVLEEALKAEDLERVRELLPKVRDAFATAADEAKVRLTQSVDEARAAMRAVAAEATTAGAPTNAKAEFIEAESLAGAAEKLVARGELDLAVAQLGRAADAYRAAATAAARANERALLEKELPALRAARAEAERANAPTLAADAFAATARDQAELETALAAGELTRVRTLLPKIGEGYAAATAAAVMAQAGRAAVEARTAMETARDAAIAAGAERYVPDALGKVRAREREGSAAEERQQWERAEKLHRETAKAYDDVRAATLRRAEEQRLASELAAARTAMEEARTRAKNAGAAQHAAELYKDAAAIAKEAGSASNDAAGMARATAEFARATEQYDAATAEAERIARRLELQETLAAVEDAKKLALDAGAGRNPEFLAAADELAAAERALAADELSLVVSSAAAARERFGAAKSAVERAKAEAEADAALADVAAQCAEAREAGAETFAAATWARAIDQQKQALARRHDGDCEAVLPLATAAGETFDAALGETLAAALASAETAKKAAALAGADDKAASEPDKLYATGKQRRDEKKLVNAASAFRKAADLYEVARKSRIAAAQKAESEAKSAQQEAGKADAAKLAADEHKSAAAALERAAQALANGRAREAEQSFEEAARGFRGAVEIAAREKKRVGARTARDAAVAARERATEVGAAELAGADLKRGSEAFTAGERAVEAENYAGAETEFAKARDAFARSHDVAVRAALERDMQEVKVRAERLRAERAPAATGFFARRKLAKADAVLERGNAAAKGGDFPAASAAFKEAAELFTALPAPTTPPPAPPPAPTAAPAARKGGKAPASKPTRAPSGGESTTIVDGATAIASAPLEGTAVVSAPSLEGATMVAGPVAAKPATVVGTAVPESRGLPIAWIGAAAAGLALIGGVWMLRGRVSEAPAPVTPPKVASNEVPKKADAVPPPVEPKAVEPKVEPRVAEQPREPEPPAATAVQVAKVEEPPAPAPPRITSFFPETDRIEPATESQQFRVALADPKDATYAWSVDGKALADATQPTVSVPAKQAPQRVAVVARTAGGEARREWELAALAPAPPPEVPTTAPVISGFEPREKALQLAPGKSRRFSVKVKPDGGAPVRYAWSVDGKAAGGNTATFDFAAEDDDEGASRQVRAEVSNGVGQPVRNDWTVNVPLAPISITRQSPAPSEIVADLGDTTDFSVEARAGRTGTSGLSYAWTVNKRPADASGARFAYRADRAGSTDVEVRIEAPDRPAATRRWTVKSREPAAEPTRVAALPPRVEPTPVAPRVGGDAKRELENWIASYRAAYQDKDVDRLVALGVLKPDNRSKLAAALNDLADLKVSIASSSIEVQGPDSAVVSLTREDSFNAGGRRQSQSINIKKSLRKVGGSWVAQ